MPTLASKSHDNYDNNNSNNYIDNNNIINNNNNINDNSNINNNNNNNNNNDNNNSNNNNNNNNNNDTNNNNNNNNDNYDSNNNDNYNNNNNNNDNSYITNQNNDYNIKTHINSEIQLNHEKEKEKEKQYIESLKSPKHIQKDMIRTYDSLDTVPKSPVFGRSRSFSTGTGATSNVYDSSISTGSSGFFSSLFATPSKHLRKRYGPINDNNNNNNNNNNSNNIIKSRLCLQISVKSTSKYRLCDSNPQDEGDSNWAIITGIYQQSFILRGDNCDFQDKLVSSDGLVTVHMNEEEL